MPDQMSTTNVTMTDQTPVGGMLPATGQTPPQTPPVATWDEWLKGQPDDVRTMYEQHTTGLKSALDGERQQRRDLERQVKDLAAKAKEGSDERARLDEISGQLETANLRASFYEDGARPEIGCSDLRLAWMAVQANRDEFVHRGRGGSITVDWAGLKEQHPLLFKAPASAVPPGNAGSGTQNIPTTRTMNDAIRRAAGRQ